MDQEKGNERGQENDSLGVDALRSEYNRLAPWIAQVKALRDHFESLQEPYFKAIQKTIEREEETLPVFCRSEAAFKNYEYCLKTALERSGRTISKVMHEKEVTVQFEGDLSVSFQPMSSIVGKEAIVSFIRVSTGEEVESSVPLVYQYEGTDWTLKALEFGSYDEKGTVVLSDRLKGLGKIVKIGAFDNQTRLVLQYPEGKSTIRLEYSEAWGVGLKQPKEHLLPPEFRISKIDRSNLRLQKPEKRVECERTPGAAVLWNQLIQSPVRCITYHAYHVTQNETIKSLQVQFEQGFALKGDGGTIAIESLRWQDAGQGWRLREMALPIESKSDTPTIVQYEGERVMELMWCDRKTTSPMQRQNGLPNAIQLEQMMDAVRIDFRFYNEYASLHRTDGPGEIVLSQDTKGALTVLNQYWFVEGYRDQGIEAQKEFNAMMMEKEQLKSTMACDEKPHPTMGMNKLRL